MEEEKEVNEYTEREAEINLLEKENDSLRKSINNIFDEIDELEDKDNKERIELWTFINRLIENEINLEDYCGE